MRLTQVGSVALAGLLAASMAGCGNVDFGTPSQPDTAQREQAVTVVPEFTVTGASAMPGKLYLNELGLTISEIRLEPLSTEFGAVAYSTRNPTELRFDVAHGETVKLGEPVELPRAGRYLVSVRLEPISQVEQSADGASEQVSPSFSVAGFVAGNGVVRVDPRYDGKHSDGSPVPMPFDQRPDGSTMHDNPALPTDWTAFHYDSRRSVFYTLNEVNFESGKQLLSFEFDVHDWALELVDPLINAVKHNEDLGSPNKQGVDVTTPLESTGYGAETLFENAKVRAMPDHQGI